MKTFDAAVAVHLDTETWDEELGHPLFVANVASQSQDIKANYAVARFVVDLIMETLRDPTGFSITNIRSTIYSAFHMGLMIGMEMNAAELTSAADGRAPQKEGA